MKAIQEHDDNLEQNPDRIKFICTANDVDEIISYNELLEYCSIPESSDSSLPRTDVREEA